MSEGELGPAESVIDLAALELERDGRLIVQESALRLSGLAEEIGAGETGLRVSRLETEGFVEVGERFVAVAGGGMEFAAGPESGDVGAVGGDRFVVSGQRLDGAACLCGFGGALRGGLRFLLIRLGIFGRERSEQARQGEGHDGNRGVICDTHRSTLQCTRRHGRTIWAAARYDELVTWR